NGNWGGWGGWGSCNRNCGGGTRSRSRSCNNPSPAGSGSGCSGSSSQSSSCNTHSCAVHGNWGGWGSWASCTRSCGSGTKTRYRSCNNPAPSNGGNQCSGSSSHSTSCNTHSCPIHGGWSSWGSYGSCSKTCASGTKTRSRSCNNPAPQHGGNSCSGSSSSSASCNTHSCPIHGGWSSWGSYGSCSRTCGGGSKSRSRSCTNPTPQHGGNSCSGSGTSSTSCNTHNCPINGAWGSWGSWGTCTVTCGGGSQQRSRACDSPAPQYGGSQCPSSSTSTQACNTHHCPIDGQWGNWGAWGSCTVTCGGGTQDRSRQCTNPAPQYGGANCAGSGSSRQDCNTHHCPIDGAWGGWGSWGSCTVTCGGGIQNRVRSCDSPAPQYGGAACPSFSSSTQSCNTHNCPIDGAWGSWASWGTCSLTCGGGTQDRSRTCTNPAPQYGGANCPNSATSRQDCNTQNCPIDGAWSSWGAWGTCTVTCGGGTQVKTRSCTNPTPQYGGAICTGADSATQDCNTQVCIIDGAWGAWGAWGSCTVTCDGGQKSRARICDDPAPANGGLPCSGNSGEFDDCNTQSCPTVPPGQYQQLCPAGWFTCESGAMTCIQEVFKCDCSRECDDGSDETEGYAGCSASLLLACGGASGLVQTTILAVVCLICAILINAQGFIPT
ncbi:hypothetical protein FSP39_009582, partial [Pinctada imbricata]